MKKNILQQVGTREEQYTVTIIDIPEAVDELTGETIPAVTHEETRIRLIPIMQAVTVDMTAEEEAAFLVEMPEPGANEPPSTLEERVDTLETDVDSIITGLEALGT